MEKKLYIDILVSRITSLCDSRNESFNLAGTNSQVGKDFLNNIKKGSIPSSDKLARLADYFDCSVDYLLGRTDNPEVSPETYIAGQNSIQTVKSKNVTINNVSDNLSDDFMNIFNKLSTVDKIKVMSFAVDIFEKY